MRDYRDAWIRLLFYSSLFYLSWLFSVVFYKLIWRWISLKWDVDTQITPKNYELFYTAGIAGYGLGVFLWASWASSTRWLLYVEWVLVTAITSALGFTLGHIYSAWEERKYE